MKKLFLPIAAILTLVVAFSTGCGGGGGGGSTGSTGSTGGNNFTTVRAEAVLSSTNQIIDPQNIMVGDTVQFEVVGYDAQRQRHVLSATGWTTTDTGNTAGTLTSAGVFTATHSTNGATFTATASLNGTPYHLVYQVKPVQAIVTGNIVDSNGVGADVEIIFLNSNGTEAGRVHSAFNGFYRGSVAPTATSLNILTSSLPAGFYYKSFVYSGKRFSMTIVGCNGKPLPTLTQGVQTSIPLITIDAATTPQGQQNPPPPPPDGCS